MGFPEWLRAAEMGKEPGRGSLSEERGAVGSHWDISSARRLLVWLGFMHQLRLLSQNQLSGLMRTANDEHGQSCQQI